MKYTIQPIEKTTVINLRGWEIVRPDGVTLKPFTTRRQAEQYVEFFTDPGVGCYTCGARWEGNKMKLCEKCIEVAHEGR